jgi:NAD(P)H dehydrogenase (quinone)
MISIVFHSMFGSTGHIAAAVAAGAREIDAHVNMLAIDPRDIGERGWSNADAIAQMHASDALIFGSPTYMGMVSGVFKTFADATGFFWGDMPWRDKVAGGFTTSSRSSGDKLSTLHYLYTLAMQHRMIWVGNDAIDGLSDPSQDGMDRFGFYCGVGAEGGVPSSPRFASLPHPGDVATAKRYGRRIADIAARMRQGAQR